MSMTEEKRQYLFLSEQTLLYNVAVRSRRGGKESIYTLAEAGQNWYDIQVSQEMILRGQPGAGAGFSAYVGRPGSHPGRASGYKICRNARKEPDETSGGDFISPRSGSVRGAE